MASSSPLASSQPMAAGRATDVGMRTLDHGDRANNRRFDGAPHRLDHHGDARRCGAQRLCCGCHRHCARRRDDGERTCARRDDSQGQDAGERRGPDPSSRSPSEAQRRRNGVGAHREQRSGDEQVDDQRGAHDSSFSRSASSRRMRSSSSRDRRRSATNCANIRSAEPWKIASLMRASALPPARSAPIVGK